MDSTVLFDNENLFEGENPIDTGDISDDDGLGGYIAPESLDEFYLNTSNQQDEEENPQKHTKESKIDHSSGVYRMDRSYTSPTVLPLYSLLVGADNVGGLGL